MTTPPDYDLVPWGLLPRTSLVEWEFPAVPTIGAATVAATVGEWRPAADLLADKYGDWDFRACAVTALAKVAANDDRWLDSWQTASPDDGHAAVVRCAATRSPTDAEKAIKALPDDPTPWVTLLALANDLHYDQAKFDEVWRALTERAPLHRRGHQSALAYRAAESPERLFEFAQEAAEKSPSLSVLMMRAAASCQGWRRPAVRAALDTLLHWLANEGAESVDVRDDFGWAAMALVENGRGTEALRLFQGLGTYAAGAPWSWAAAPAELFNTYRLRAAKLAKPSKHLSRRWSCRMARSAAFRGAESFAGWARSMYRLIERRPGNAQVHATLMLHICLEQYEAGRYDVAAVAARAAADVCRLGGGELELRRAFALVQLGLCHRALGQPAAEEAREAAEIEARLQPDNSTYTSALMLLAEEQSRTDQDEAAIETAGKAAEIARARGGGINLMPALRTLHDVLKKADREEERRLVEEEITRRKAAFHPQP
jgi:hypothetical protein